MQKNYSKQKQFYVTGMSCAACSARVQNAVQKVIGVKNANVNLLTLSMTVESQNDFDTELTNKIIQAVQNAGYNASIKDDSLVNSHATFKDAFDSETKILCKRFLVSLILLLPLMYVCTFVQMFNFPLPLFLDNLNKISFLQSYNNNAIKLIVLSFFEAINALVILFINKKFFVSGTKALLKKACNMDTLVALGAGVSYTYSLINLVLFAIQTFTGIKESSQVAPHFYFESSAMIVTLITIGKTLESFSKGKTTSAINSLIKLVPQKATILVQEDLSSKELSSEELTSLEKTIDVSQIKIGDLVVVKSGEAIPIDAIIIEGFASINESTLTGESIPCDKKAGDEVFACTLCVNGNLIIKATKLKEQTLFSKIIQLVTDSSSTKAPIAKIADKVSAIFVPAVLAISLITFVTWIILSHDFALAINFCVCVLVISCPCSLGLATPVSIMVSNGVAARKGILFKTATALEQTAKAQVCVLDKTGTLTNGVPVVTDVVCSTDFLLQDFLQIIYLLEKNSSHPLAKAITLYCKDFFSKQNIQKQSFCKNIITDFAEKIGSGVCAKLNGKTIKGGNESFIFNESCIKENKETQKQIELFAQSGKTPIIFLLDNKLLGIICLLDVEKPTSAKAVFQLKKNHIEPVLLTGDNKNTAYFIANKLDIQKVFANVKPDQKANIVAKLSAQQNVLMVGDGVNDAPSLKMATVGITIGSASDVAIDAADIVLLKNDILDVLRAIKISQLTLKNIKQNLFWAFFYNALFIPVAAGVFYNFGITLVPMFCAATMSVSSFCVVMNALRLNFMNTEKSLQKNCSKDNKNALRYKHKGGKKMKTIKIEGMMCQHCQKHVKDALEKLGVTCDVDYQTGLAKVYDTNISDSQITNAIVEAGYTVISITSE